MAMKRILRGASWTFGLAALGIGVLIEISYPDMPRSRLLMTFWPYYLGVILLVTTAIATELIAGGMKRRG